MDIISLEVATVLALAVEPQLPLVVCTSTGGLCADFDIKKIASHARVILKESTLTVKRHGGCSICTTFNMVAL